MREIPRLNFTPLHDSFPANDVGFAPSGPERKILKYYPIFWDISGKKCVVVGGGDVAARKVVRLLDCGAEMCVAPLPAPAG